LHLWKKNFVVNRSQFLLLVPLLAREIYETNKYSLSPEDVRLFQKPGPKSDRRRRKKVESHILADSPIKDRIEKEALARKAVKTKYWKAAKKYINKI
jgi:hypothetical protein